MPDARLNLPHHACVNLAPLVAGVAQRFYALSSRRHALHYRNVQIAVHRKRQRARYRRCRHNQNIRLVSRFICQFGALLNAEAVLFIRNDKREFIEDNVIL